MHFVGLPVRLLLLTWLLVLFAHCPANCLFEFPKDPVELSKKDINYLSSISVEEWRQFIELGLDSDNKEENLEENLLRSHITVENGSISHAQLLDSLPNAKAQEDSELAMKVLKCSLYVYQTKCAQHGVKGAHCAAFLEDKTLPAGSELLNECTRVIQSRRDGHHPFRRLLPRHYKDDFYEMFSEDESTSPLLISSKLMPGQGAPKSQESVDNQRRNLAFVQWSQFVEHDLSKPVVTSMSNGAPIECCNRDQFKLQARFRHPACAPVYSRRSESLYGRETCFNYVRSALAVGSRCSFGALEQLNQATGSLDLSQLYGFTEVAQSRMRAHRNGKLKSTPATLLKQELLPLATVESHEFCAWKLSGNDSTCFMAGDSRVNTNPFVILIYTIFMRNHNQIASELKSGHPDWDDNRLFHAAKAINDNIYRHIIFEEWLPQAIGKTLTESINAISSSNYAENKTPGYLQTSNEFAVAAIRFYLSMMPNELRDFTAERKARGQTDAPYLFSNNVFPSVTIFSLEDQIYRPDMTYSAMKLNDILESLLNQSAMKMDASYVNSLRGKRTEGSDKATYADILAFDIQRGRDHGLQKYVKYLEVCANVQINNWKDLEAHIAKADIYKIMSVYESWSEVDLIVGGVLELPVNGSTVGPTFTCILAEQFAKIRQRQHIVTSIPELGASVLNRYKTLTAADIFCINSELDYVPKNIFQLSSERNPLVSCAELLSAQGL